MASAVNAVENMAARGDIQGLSHYAGVDSNINSNGLHEQTKHNYHDPRGVMTDHNKAIDDLNSRMSGFNQTRNAPNDVKSEGLAGGIQKAASATEYKAGTAIEERDNKINYANIQKDIKDGKDRSKELRDFLKGDRNM
ncbi:hypothetical protein HpCK101_32760 [Helicobacter pylori]